MNPQRPYIKVAGISTRTQASAVEQLFQQRIGDLYIGIELALGVVVSDKTLTGGTNKHPELFPRIEDVPIIFARDGGLSSAVKRDIHFWTHRPEKLMSDLAMLAKAVNGTADRIQLDIAWPNARVICEFLNGHSGAHQKFEIILQVGRDAVEQVIADNPGLSWSKPRALGNEIAEQVYRYGGIIHRVLLDMSSGKGIPLDGDILVEFIGALNDHHCPVAVTVAGGLSGFTIHLLRPILERYPNTSIDAQSGLRDETNQLSPSCVDAYFLHFCRLCHEIGHLSRVD
jgi:hypothetical protein